MIDNIIYGMTKELKLLVGENEGMVVFDTNLNNDISFSLPLIVLECDDAPESSALIGGNTRMDWNFRMRVYAQEPDAYIDDSTTGSTSNLSVIDLIKAHFIKGIWETKEMRDLLDNYNFRMTYTGTLKAPDIKTEDRTIKGFTHNFETIGIDCSTNTTTTIIVETQTVEGDVEFD